MELVKCPICGEMYSESYKACPFCAESGPYEGTVKRRRVPGRRLKRRKNPKIIGPAMILVLLLLAAVLVYAFFGDHFGRAGKDPVEPLPMEVKLSVEPASVELAAGEIRALNVSGSGGYVWRSSDETVATVDDRGTVTAVANGSAIITVTDRQENTARCEVTVADTGTDPVDPTEPTEPTEPVDPTPPDDPAPAKELALCTRWNGRALSKIYDPEIGERVYDMTLSLGSDPITLFIYGTDSPVTWSSSSSAVTVSSDGVVKRVSRGTAYITATVDGQTLKCRVLG